MYVFLMMTLQSKNYTDVNVLDGVFWISEKSTANNARRDS